MNYDVVNHVEGEHLGGSVDGCRLCSGEHGGIYVDGRPRPLLADYQRHPKPVSELGAALLTMTVVLAFLGVLGIVAVLVVLALIHLPPNVALWVVATLVASGFAFCIWAARTA